MVTAYVLINVPSNRSAAVVEDLKRIPEIKEAAAVYGETDVLAKVVAGSLPDLDKVVLESIQRSADVQSTRSLIAVEKLHWSR